MDERENEGGNFRKGNMFFWKSMFKRQNDDSNTEYKNNSFFKPQELCTCHNRIMKFFFVYGILVRGLTLFSHWIFTATYEVDITVFNILFPIFPWGNWDSKCYRWDCKPHVLNKYVTCEWLSRNINKLWNV